jgi:hypothetical protein
MRQDIAALECDLTAKMNLMGKSRKMLVDAEQRLRVLKEQQVRSIYDF